MEDRKLVRQIQAYGGDSLVESAKSAAKQSLPDMIRPVRQHLERTGPGSNLAYSEEREKNKEGASYLSVGYGIQDDLGQHELKETPGGGPQPPDGNSIRIPRITSKKNNEGFGVITAAIASLSGRTAQLLSRTGELLRGGVPGGGGEGGGQLLFTHANSSLSPSALGSRILGGINGSLNGSLENGSMFCFPPGEAQQASQKAAGDTTAHVFPSTQVAVRLGGILENLAEGFENAGVPYHTDADNKLAEIELADGTIFRYTTTILYTECDDRQVA